MAKRRAHPQAEYAIEDEDGTLLDVGSVMKELGSEGAATAVAAEPAAPAKVPKGRYFVKLDCPTPILHKDGCEVDADTADEARKAFCELNGLSDSSHQWTITRIS